MRALLIVQNESVPQDPRLWQQAQSLRSRGWDVDVLCLQANPKDRRHEVVEGIEIWRVRLPHDREGLMGFLAEYVAAIVLMGGRSLQLMLKRRYDLVQFANSPDFLLCLALVHRLRGAAVMFDHRDVGPELVLTKGFGEKGPMHRMMLMAERCAYRAADVVTTVNESYRQVAHQRGGCDPDDVFVVRCAPDMDRFVVREGTEPTFVPRTFTLGYLGIVGAHDGVEDFVRLVRIMNDRGYDTGGVVVGGGSCIQDMRRVADHLDIADRVAFLGRWPSDRVAEALLPADICVVPDPLTAFTAKCTVAKTVEYLAMGKAVVAYDLPETRVSGGDVVQYAEDFSPSHLADQVQRLFDDPDRRRELGKLGYERAIASFTWDRIEPRFLAAVERALALKGRVFVADASVGKASEGEGVTR